MHMHLTQARRWERPSRSLSQPYAVKANRTCLGASRGISQSRTWIPRDNSGYLPLLCPASPSLPSPSGITPWFPTVTITFCVLRRDAITPPTLPLLIPDEPSAIELARGAVGSALAGRPAWAREAPARDVAVDVDVGDEGVEACVVAFFAYEAEE